MFNYSATYTDQYQLTMALAYFKQGKHEDRAIFDYFFRKLPFEGGYAVLAGIDTLIDVLENLSFDEKDLELLKQYDFPKDFLNYLKEFKFHGNIYSSREGDIVFPTRPVLQVEGTLLEAQIVETLLLNILNYQTLIATKASRMRLIAKDKSLIDFGLRRAHGPGGYYASRAAIIGGFNGTSNVLAGRDFNIPISGTMAHSFVQSYDDELTAFREFAEARPDDCVLLVDTYDTLKSGVPNAIKVGQEMKERGQELKGIRLDSGDLAYLAKKSREMLNDAGLDFVKIAASNQLDEYLIKSLLEQEAPIDLFGVGTNLVTGQEDAAFDGVYKLAFAHGKPRLKLSENKEKISLPGKKQVYRLKNSKGQWIGGDVVALHDEKPDEIGKMSSHFEADKSMEIETLEKESLLETIMENGKRTIESKTLDEISAYREGRIHLLPDEYKRFEYPHTYKIGISESLKNQRDKLIDEYKER